MSDTDTRSACLNRRLTEPRNSLGSGEIRVTRMRDAKPFGRGSQFCNYYPCQSPYPPTQGKFMTTEHTTEPSAVSRRTILRTTAHAAWMVPAISLASAVPAMAACSLSTDFTLTTGALSGVTYAGGKGYRTQSFQVSNQTAGASSGAAGTASLLVTIEKAASLAGLPSYAGWSISVPGWVAVGRQPGPGDGRKNSKYLFTRAFGCGESAPANVTYSWTSGLSLVSEPEISAAVSP